MAKNFEIEPCNISRAIEPLKQVAIEGNRKQAQNIIDSELTKLAENDFNLSQVYPGRYSTQQKQRVRMFTENDHERTQRVRREKLARGEKIGWMTELVKQSDMMEARYLDLAEKEAIQRHDAYTLKLRGKIGEEVESANLHSGENLWFRSTLEVVTKSGEHQVWVTQMVFNVSKLGNPFVQFRTRRVKT